MRLLLALVLLVSAGCLGPRSDPSSFFIITPATEEPTGSPLPVTLGIGPVTVPGYLDRPELVTRLSANELSVSEIERWAEPLPDNVLRVVTDNLLTTLQPDDHVIYPWFESAGVDFAVAVDLRRFEADSTGSVTLEAAWRIRGDEGETLRQDVSLIEQGVTGPGTGESVAALSTALARLAEEIARAVRSIQGG